MRYLHFNTFRGVHDKAAIDRPDLLERQNSVNWTDEQH
jgi:hypothetical protein